MELFIVVSGHDRHGQHIQKSLTVENIPFEVFSPFSATFAEVRKVQVNYFLEHWGEIRSSEAMRNVWRQIRNGRHPGFEEGPWLLFSWMTMILMVIKYGPLLPFSWNLIHAPGLYPMSSRRRLSCCCAMYIHLTQIGPS